MLTTVNVSVIVNDQNGLPVAGALVSARLNTAEVAAGYVLPDKVEAIANAAGVAVLALWPNELGATQSQYEFKIKNPKTQKTTQLLATIPNVNCDLHAVANLPTHPGKLEGQISLDLAVSAASASIANAASALVSKNLAASSEVNSAASQLSSANSATAASGLAAAALASKNAAATSETNAAASATTATNATALKAPIANSSLTGMTSAEGISLNAISQSIHFGAVVKAFHYDTRRDSDGGAWRKRCADKSWYTEAINGLWLGQAATAAAAWALAGAVTGAYFQNTTDGKFYALGAASPAVTEVFRGNVREFPAQVAVIVETGRVVIYDLTQAGTPMFFVVKLMPASTGLWQAYGATVATMLNGALLIGTSSSSNVEGLRVINFVSDSAYTYCANGNYYSTYSYRNGRWPHGLASRHSATLTNKGDVTSAPIIAAAFVNDVTAIVLPDAPIDPATGLPIPTIAVATNGGGGVSIIKSDGTVANWLTAHGDIYMATLDANGRIFACGGAGVYFKVWFKNSLPVGVADNGVDYVFNQSSIPARLGDDNDNGQILKQCALGNGGKAFGSGAILPILTILKDNPASPTKGMVANLTNAYNTGWQVGDIRGCWLADTVAGTVVATDSDRSVKNNGLTVAGTITKAAVATGAQLMGYSGFSAANYFEQAYSANMDFGTGDFCVMGWVNATTSGGTMFHRGVYSGSYSGSAISVACSSDKVWFRITDDAYASSDSFVGGIDILDSTWHFVACLRSGNTLYIYVDGKLDSSTAVVNASASLSNASAIARLGLGIAGVDHFSNGSLALWRIGATAPSLDQIAHIYRTELALFQPGTNCTLDGTSSVVTALEYDDVTDTLHAGTSWGRSSFRDLVRTESEISTVGAITSLAAHQGAIITGGATSGRYYQPAMLLRDELRRSDEARQALGKIPVYMQDVGVTSKTAFTLQAGYQVVAVYAAGLLRDAGVTLDYTLAFDGFRWTVNFAVAPANGARLNFVLVRS